MLVRYKDKSPENNRRSEHRLLCSNLVQLSWIGNDRRPCKEMAVLENISKGGLGLAIFVSVPIEIGLAVSLLANRVELGGHVRRCAYRQNGYILGLELEEKYQLTEGFVDSFTLEHLVDIDRLDLT